MQAAHAHHLEKRKQPVCPENSVKTHGNSICKPDIEGDIHGPFQPAGKRPRSSASAAEAAEAGAPVPAATDSTPAITLKVQDPFSIASLREREAALKDECAALKAALRKVQKLEGKRRDLANEEQALDGVLKNGWDWQNSAHKIVAAHAGPQAPGAAAQS